MLVVMLVEQQGLIQLAPPMALYLLYIHKFMMRPVPVITVQAQVSWVAARLVTIGKYLKHLT